MHFFDIPCSLGFQKKQKLILLRSTTNQKKGKVLLQENILMGV